MERKHIPETENRLIILYALRRLGPVTAMQLLQAMAEGNLMNYLPLQLARAELENHGQITQRAHPLGNLIEMTREGDYALDSFEQRIPASRRHLIDERAEDWKTRFANEQMAPAEAFPLPDGRIALHLRLLVRVATLLDLFVYVPREERLTFMQERWRGCVQAAYATALTLLTRDYDPSLPMPGTAEDAVRQSGPNDWLLTLAASGIDLMMSRPAEPLARSCAAKWPEISGELRSFVLRELKNARPD